MPIRRHHLRITIDGENAGTASWTPTGWEWSVVSDAPRLGSERALCLLRYLGQLTPETVWNAGGKALVEALP